MRKIILLGLLLGSLPAAAADPAPAPAPSGVYRWVDSNGVVHYSDAAPSKDAKPTDLPQIQTFKSDSVKHGEAIGSGAPAPGTAAPPAYRPVITSPSNQDTIRDDSGVISVSVSPPSDFVLLTYYLDGTAQNATPTTSTTLQFQGVERGSHTITVASVDGSGKELSRSDPVTIYYMPPRVNQAAPPGKH